jgi:hypothetical protein
VAKVKAKVRAGLSISTLVFLKPKLKPRVLLAVNGEYTRQAAFELGKFKGGWVKMEGSI